MNLELLTAEFSVLKVADGAHLPAKGFAFTARTDLEYSLVCETEHAPSAHLAREDGWRAFRVAGQLDFSLIGILAELAGALAEAGISVFCLSTYDTDYLLVKADSLARARGALSARGHVFA